MKKGIIVTAALAAMLSAGATTPMWVRDVAISPDATKVAFTYKGDIYVVSSLGGKATQLTTNKGFDSKPYWSPDGMKIVFASDREGSDDIYVVDSQGGTPKRLTTHSGAETPIGFLNDSTVLFSSAARPSEAVSFAPKMPQTYSVNVNRPGERPLLFSPIAMQHMSAKPDGALLYQDKKSVENKFRKHERSAGTCDIWLMKSATDFRKLTDFKGHDLNPVWTGENTFCYVSEKDGTLNVYSCDLMNNKEIQLTDFKEHPVRSLSAANDGTLAFSWDGEAYVKRPDGKAQKLNIDVITDDYDSDLVKNIRNEGASNMAVSPDGESVAFVLRGDIYVTSTKYKTTKRITASEGQERSISFGSDGRTLVYDSDRDGTWAIYRAKIVKDDEKNFAYATEISEERLYTSSKSAQQPVVSPDGKYMAFLEDRCELKVMELDSKKVNTALEGKYNYSYTDGDIEFEWSPDSKWLLTSYIGKGGWNNTDIALVSRDGKSVVDLTESGYADGNPHWVLGGKGLVYETGKYGMKSHGSWGNQSDAVLMVLNSEAWDDFNLTEEEAAMKEKAEKEEKEKSREKDGDSKKAKKDKKKTDDKKKAEKDNVISVNDFDLKSRRYRTRRLTQRSSMLGDHYLSPKGDKFYYTASATEGGKALYEHDLRKGDTKVLAKDVSGMLIPDKEGENLFVLSDDGMSKISLADGEATPIEFEAFYDRKPSGERNYIYDHMLTQVKEKFYDEKLHGVDWESYGKHYRKFLPHINNNRDFADLLSEILGELNASHTGGGTFSAGAKLPTAELGVVIDESHTGEGIKIAEILSGGPLSTRKVAAKPGETILAIDGKKIGARQDYYPLLEGKANKKIRLTIVGTDGKKRECEVRPITITDEHNLLYRRWVEHNEHIVDSLSEGKIGYVHVEGMDTESFQTVYDRLLGHYRNCEAVIVDTRYNGGGWLHNDLAILLGGKEYVRYAPRGRYIGSDPFSQWTKPSVMLVNETNYSDAHGSPYTYKTLGLGDVVGAPVPGTMTAVWWEFQIDPSIYFGIPQVTSLDKNGEPLENKQLVPDVLIYNKPEEMLKGQDAQLEGAVRHLQKKSGTK